MSPHPPMVVPKSRDIVLGRGEECDFPIPSRGASRKHARIGYRGEDIVIKDLKSTNGTFVNGDKIEEERVLKPGDRINVGGAVLTFCHVLSQVEAGAPAHADATVLFDRPPSAEADQELFRGDLSQIPVAAVLQVLAEGMKSGMLRVESRQQSARCWLEEGKLVHAETATLEGMEAAIRICGLSGGRFIFDDTRAPPERSVSMSVTELLLEASRIMDEGRLES
ncbi:MAG: DUF4388 domain-containing protein [Planctomycetota bacterium]